VLVACILGAAMVWYYSDSMSIMGATFHLYPYRAYSGIFIIGAFIGLGGLIFSIAIGSKRKRSNRSMPKRKLEVITDFQFGFLPKSSK